MREKYICSNYIIDIALNNYEDIFNSWDSSSYGLRDLNSSLKAFILESSYRINLNHKLTFRFNIKQNIKDFNMEKLLKQSIINHFEYSLLIYNKRLYENRKRTIYYSLTSIFFIILSIYLQSLSRTTFFEEIILYSFTIGSWVFLWEAISIVFIQRRELLNNKKHYKRLLNSTIVYRY